MNNITPDAIVAKKGRDTITMLTCYDYSFARILDETGIDMILVGDSLANVVLGMEETRAVSISEMLNHTRAVAQGIRRPLVVADMPYASYQRDFKKSVYYAKKFLEAGASSVKIEWFSPGRKKKCQGQEPCLSVVKQLRRCGIPVMGHIGLTPQTAHLLGGYKVQGKDKESAQALLKQAQALEEAGAFSLVLECIPSQLSAHITQRISIPTIGIGAGSGCDGQVLVLYDLLGLYKKVTPRFVRRFRDSFSEVQEAVQAFISEVKKGTFPSTAESYGMNEEQWQAFLDHFPPP